MYILFLYTVSILARVNSRISSTKPLPGTGPWTCPKTPPLYPPLLTLLSRSGRDEAKSLAGNYLGAVGPLGTDNLE